MKTVCPPCYHHNGFVATHALYVRYIYTKRICNRMYNRIYIYGYTYDYIYVLYIYTVHKVHELLQSHCGDNREGKLFS